MNTDRIWVTHRDDPDWLHKAAAMALRRGAWAMHARCGARLLELDDHRGVQLVQRAVNADLGRHDAAPWMDALAALRRGALDPFGVCVYWAALARRAWGSAWIEHPDVASTATSGAWRRAFSAQGWKMRCVMDTPLWVSRPLCERGARLKLSQAGPYPPHRGPIVEYPLLPCVPEVTR